MGLSVRRAVMNAAVTPVAVLKLPPESANGWPISKSPVSFGASNVRVARRADGGPGIETDQTRFLDAAETRSRRSRDEINIDARWSTSATLNGG